MSRIPDDYEPEDGRPTKRDLPSLKPLAEPIQARHPDAKLDLDRAEDILDLPPPKSRAPATA
jgi:hypothetical protein